MTGTGGSPLYPSMQFLTYFLMGGPQLLPGILQWEETWQLSGRWRLAGDRRVHWLNIPVEMIY